MPSPLSVVVPIVPISEVIATVRPAVEEVMLLPYPSLACTVIKVVLTPSAVMDEGEAEIVELVTDGPPRFISKEAEVGACTRIEPAGGVAVNEYPIPALLMLVVLNVAVPFDEVAVGFVITLVGPTGFVTKARVIAVGA